MIEVWTDGASRGSGLSACGFVTYLDNILVSRVYNYRLSTNNRMESGAILSALKFLSNRNLFNENIVIYSDSNWAIGAIFYYWNITKNTDIVYKARELLSKFSNITPKKVKGHSDNEGNILIDKLLNESMDSNKAVFIDKVYEELYSEVNKSAEDLCNIINN